MFRRFIALLCTVLAVLPLVVMPSAAAPAAVAAQTLTWTANDSITGYASAPTTAVAGDTTIIWENSAATGNTTGMPHTLTFDTTTEGYNHDVNLNILANPFDANGGRHEAQVTLTPGRYRYFCSIPGHSQMVGEFTVTAGGEDTTPPTVSAVVSGDRDTGGNYLGSATVTLSASDAESGVDRVEYSLDGAAFVTYTAPVVVNTVGAHMVHYRATDRAGNTSPELMESFTVVAPPIDTTPPTVNAEVSGNREPDGDYLGSATVTLSASDAESGVDFVEYEVDDTGFQRYSTPVVVSALGDHAVQYRATDKAGNLSPVGSVSFRVVEPPVEDTTPPTVSAVVTGERDTNGNYVGSALVTLSAEDAQSGVDRVEYSLDGAAFARYTEPVTVNSVGAHMVHYRATDVAGNTSPERMESFTVVAPPVEDTTPPTVSATVSGNRDADGNYLGSATVTLSASDAESGVDRVEYSFDGGAFVRYTTPVMVDVLGAHMVHYRATDVAGNTSPERMESFTVVAPPADDTTAPTASASVSGNRDGDGNYLGSATVTVSASDAESGVDSMEYSLDDGSWTAYTEPVTIDATGDHTVRYRATDHAGNTSEVGSVSFRVVESGPDACPDSDTRGTVIIGVEDSGVTNVDTGNGCTINDLIDEHAQYANHAYFVRHVEGVTDALVASGLLTHRDKGSIVRAAARSDIGK
jgi:plastocyanin